MGKSYNADLTDDVSQVRFLIGDNVESKMVLDDGEIAWLITQEANVYMAAAAACDSIALKIQTTDTASGKAGAITRKRVGNTDISYANGRTTKDYQDLAKTLRNRGRNYQMPFAGGISVADKQTREQDTDRPTDGFRRGQFDDPGGLTSSRVNREWWD